MSHAAREFWTPRHARGFTLLEVIAVLVLLAILATAVTAYLAPQAESVKAPIDRLESAMGTASAMAAVVAEYAQGNRDENALDTLKSRITDRFADFYGGSCPTCTAAVIYPFTFAEVQEEKVQGLFVRITNVSTGEELVHFLAERQ